MKKKEAELLYEIFKELAHIDANLYAIGKKICSSQEDYKIFLADVSQMHQKLLDDCEATFRRILQKGS